jgi:hypothetical protein
MQYSAGMRIQAMNPAVYEKRSRLQAVLTVKHMALTIYQQNIPGINLAPMQSLRVDQVTIACKFKAEMIANAFIQARACSPAKRGGEIYAALPENV